MNVITRKARLLLILTLLVVFIKFFGHPSYVKFKSHETLISETKVPYNWNVPPAITVSAWRKNPEKGWKNDTLDGNMKHHCEIDKNVSKLYSCIDRNTFNLSQVLETKPIEIGDESRSRFTNASLWSEDLSNFDLGKVFTMNNSYSI
jgi:hypothetical protein